MIGTIYARRSVEQSVADEAKSVAPRSRTHGDNGDRRLTMRVAIWPSVDGRAGRAIRPLVSAH